MRISLALSTFNGERYLRRQLASLEAQTRPPDEVVVRDDGSTDATVSIIEDFAARAPFRVELTRGARRLGSTPSFEKVLAECSGDVIALCDQDDVWLPHKLAVLEDTFRRHPDVGLVCSNAHLIDEAGRPYRYTAWDVRIFDAKGRRMLSRGRPQPMLTRFSTQGCTLAYRAAHQQLILPFPDALRSTAPPMHHDLWISTMLGAASSVGVIDECLIEYRLHPDQQIGVGPVFADMVERPTLLRFRRAQAGGAQLVRKLTRSLAAVPGLGEYLAEQPVVRSADQAASMMEEFLAHMSFRRRLPPRRRGRLKPVARAWWRGDYHRYANGMWSVVADVVRSA